MRYSTDEIFHCYSPQLRDFLESKGLEVCVKPFRHVRTGKICWCFTKDEELNKLLQEWSDMR